MWENQLGGYFSSLNEEQQKYGEKSTLELGAEFGHVKDKREGVTNTSELPALWSWMVGAFKLTEWRLDQCHHTAQLLGAPSTLQSMAMVPQEFCKSSSLIWHVTHRQGVAPWPGHTFLLSIIFLLVYLRTVINNQCAWCPMESTVSCLAVQINFHWNCIMNLGLKKDSGRKESREKKASLCTWLMLKTCWRVVCSLPTHHCYQYSARVVRHIWSSGHVVCLWERPWMLLI